VVTKIANEGIVAPVVESASNCGSKSEPVSVRIRQQ
jgi:hypothetical protein